MRTPEVIAEDLRRLVEPGRRERLVARGLARGMIWRAGALPEDAPRFARSLTADLLDHGYLVLATSLQLRDAAGDSEAVRTGFRVAAESIESAVRRADAAAERRAENLVVAAAAFHLARLGARSYCLLSRPHEIERVSVGFAALSALMRRDLNSLTELVRSWLDDAAHSDEAVAASMGWADEDQGAGVAADDGGKGMGNLAWTMPSWWR